MKHAAQLGDDAPLFEFLTALEICNGIANLPVCEAVKPIRALTEKAYRSAWRSTKVCHTVAHFARAMNERPHPEPELIEPMRRKARRTHCRLGHELTPENAYRRPDGTRECRICRRQDRRRHPMKHKPRGGPNGRPPHRPTPELRKVVQNLASMGLTHPQIATAIGVGLSTLTKHYEDELAKGTIAVHAAVGSMFIRKCLGGDPNDPDNPPDWRKADVNALLHYVKTRMNWSDKPEPFRFGQGNDFRDI